MSTTRFATVNIGRWESSGYGTRESRRYILAGATRGWVENVGQSSVVASYYDRNHRRHQRPFWDISEAKEWVEDNSAVTA